MSNISGSSNRAISKLLPTRRDSNNYNIELCKYDFIVGDKVYIASNPDRIGTAVFNGITKFSDGVWIGVALDKPFGKNNGVVQGVTYFQCEENHGIFVRPNNLRHVSEKNLNTDKFQRNNSSLPIDSEEFTSLEPNQVLSSTNNLNLGDRVYVAVKSGSSMNKCGILRFLGPTKFSDGHWAGIELDNPVGKNDGSVNGVRYFSCKPQYGLFALVDKVMKVDSSSMKGINRMESYTKNGSSESISSVASNFSSASRTRARLGINPVSTSKKFKGDRVLENTSDRNRTVKTNVPKDIDKTSSAIQNVLKEKEQHVEQLIREREIERIDLATATAKIEELEKYHNRNSTTFSDQKLLYDKKISDLQNTVYLISQERDQLLERFEEEKKKVDDLLFRIEEKVIDESDLENKTEENESQIFELNEKLAREIEIREQLEKRIKDVPSLNDASTNEIKYVSQIKILEGKLLKLKMELNDEKSDSKVMSLSKLLEEKDAIINDLQDRFEKTKFRLSESKKEIDAVKTIQISNKDENQALKNKVLELQSYMVSLTDQLSDLTRQRQDDKSHISSSMESKDNLQCNTPTKENALINGQTKEFLDLQHTIEVLTNKNKSLNTQLSTISEEIDTLHRESESKRLEINDLQQKCKQLELEKLDYIKSKRSLVEENENLVSQISSCHQQLEKLRSQISGLLNDNKKLIEYKAETENNEKNIKHDLENLKGQINFLEIENASLAKSVHELENDSTQNSRILQMSVRIDDMETMTQDLKLALISEKEQNKALITKNATLYSELEHYKQKRDEEDNIMYDQLQSLKSINQLLESDKLSLTESMEAKTKELIVIRDRLLKISQEYESLQDNFTENNQKYEREKRLLNEKLRKAERQIDDNEKKSQFSISESASDKRKVDGKEQISLLKDAKENAEQQIGFLNNVIVKLESKFTATQLENKSLKEKLKDMENGNILQTTRPKKTVVTPRVYCDFCEIFDSHDTDKCPNIDQDSMCSSPRPNPVPAKVKIAKGPRLYCDICEIFDAHDTADCHDQQTF